ncbi:molybdopterin converting factor, this protein family, putative [Heliomicrobium modesticaldum Ice1]|uniref:Molybdopterin converting factor, this protein family, putative n=1 Tax=Heliobacterium modesticaldum (strain ATCC 51547 / Ice1) TaxID=498761 RepID=B0TA85_HELMI|nr:MoaD/ThiS family protein [Heliomicrobium modesticaldum]ABZ83622.1 molybdopterin converting factor, this protein family, putative [Heliomicrobium modesticaldum Ice1]
MSDHQRDNVAPESITVFVKLFATFRVNRFSTGHMAVPLGATVREVLSALAIPEQEVAICMVNGHSKEIDHILSDGDTLSLFPPVGGG